MCTAKNNYGSIALSPYKQHCILKYISNILIKSDRSVPKKYISVNWDHCSYLLNRPMSPYPRRDILEPWFKNFSYQKCSTFSLYQVKNIQIMYNKWEKAIFLTVAISTSKNRPFLSNFYPKNMLISCTMSGNYSQIFFETYLKTFKAWFGREKDHYKAFQLTFGFNSSNKGKFETFRSIFLSA